MEKVGNNVYRVILKKTSKRKIIPNMRKSKQEVRKKLRIFMK